MTLIRLGCAWLVGVYLGSWLHLPPTWVIACAAACTMVAVALRERPGVPLASLCLAALCLGLWRYDLARPTLVPGPLAAYNDGPEVTFRGLVVNEPVPRDRWSQLQVSVRELKAGDMWTATRGQVLVRVPSYETYRYGDVLEVSGRLQTPQQEGASPYRTYLARQGIHSTLQYPRLSLLARDQGQLVPGFLYGLKRRTQGIIAAILPEPEAALLTGVLLGSDEGIPKPLMDQFRATGTAHIIAISGFNIALISASLVKLFSRLLQRYAALVAALIAVALYTVLVGAEPPVVRAALMGALAAFALIVGRRSDALTSLVVAACLMTAWQPFSLWEVGFQLSFAASLGLVLYSGKLQAWTAGKAEEWFSSEALQRAARFVGDTLLVTLAAQITTLPLMLAYFHQFSPLSLVANLLVIPVQPAVMYLGSSAAMASLVSLRLGQWLGWVAWLPLAYTIHAVEAVARWVGTSGAMGSVPPLLIVTYYGLLSVFTLEPLRTRFSSRAVWRRLQRNLPLKAAFVVLAVALALMAAALSSLPDGRLHVSFLDVGQGDAILVQTPTGRRVLIDGGPSPALLLEALGQRLPFWDRHIDLLLLSHPHEDHLLGLLPVAQRYRVGQVLASAAPCESAVCEQWLQILREQGVSLLTVRQPLQIDLGDGPVLQVYPPADIDPDASDPPSLVARLSWGSTSCLFSGDMDAQGLRDLWQAGLPVSCTVLKVPHHGSADALDKELLAALHPNLAVISVGAGNLFGHPAPGTLELLAAQGILIYRTDQNGDIDLTVDATSWKASSERVATSHSDLIEGSRGKD